MTATVLSLMAGAVALMLGFTAGRAFQRRRFGRAAATAEEMVSTARRDARETLSRAEDEADAKAEAYRDREEAQLEHRRLELESQEERAAQREVTMEQRASNLAQREHLIIEREREVSEIRMDAEQVRETARSELERLAGFDAKAAKEELLIKVEDEGRREAMVLVRDLELKAREEADRRARRILTGAIQRLASTVVAEATVSMVPLPADDMKGRIIGRDGRNTRRRWPR